ncbi:hypothetical protein Pmani_019247 [Petrolisthes manimaculis]|uniref:Uncharacterized protein n=1 Tax=Petrolisthes manimaculis TaxID=1843537 RepID=A0AAE1PL31_9EUCA|nr:hypothetical protein Pmani_019247 [Petrolisthes manimaculis]
MERVIGPTHDIYPRSSDSGPTSRYGYQSKAWHTHSVTLTLMAYTHPQGLAHSLTHTHTNGIYSSSRFGTLTQSHSHSRFGTLTQSHSH